MKPTRTAALAWLLCTPALAISIIEMRGSGQVLSPEGEGFPNHYSEGPWITMFARFDPFVSPDEVTETDVVFGGYDGVATLSRVDGSHEVTLPLVTAKLWLQLGTASTHAAYRFWGETADGLIFVTSSWSDEFPGYVSSLAFPLSLPEVPSDLYYRTDIEVWAPEWSAYTDANGHFSVSVVGDGRPSQF